MGTERIYTFIVGGQMNKTTVFDKIRFIRGDAYGSGYILEEGGSKRPENPPNWSLRLSRDEVWELFIFLLEEFTNRKCC